MQIHHYVPIATDLTIRARCRSSVAEWQRRSTHLTSLAPRVQPSLLKTCAVTKDSLMSVCLRQQTNELT